MHFQFNFETVFFFNIYVGQMQCNNNRFTPFPFTINCFKLIDTFHQFIKNIKNIFYSNSFSIFSYVCLSIQCVDLLSRRNFRWNQFEIEKFLAKRNFLLINRSLNLFNSIFSHILDNIFHGSSNFKDLFH